MNCYKLNKEQRTKWKMKGCLDIINNSIWILNFQIYGEIVQKPIS